MITPPITQEEWERSDAHSMTSNKVVEEYMIANPAPEKKPIPQKSVEQFVRELPCNKRKP